MTDNEREIITINYKSDGVGLIIPRVKSIIHIGVDNSFNISVDKHFNRFQKKMINWCFGWEVEDVENGS